MPSAPPAPATPSPAARRLRRSLALAGASLLGALLIGLLGWNLIAASLAPKSDEKSRPWLGWATTAAGDWLVRLSYDLLFVLRPASVVPAARVVYLDEHAARKLEQSGCVWDRKLHADLVRRLTREGARAIFFDIVFPDPWPDPAVDEDLAAAMREHGNVYIGAALELDYNEDKALEERTIPPTPVLRQAAAGWGLIAFRPIDSDYGVRRLYTGLHHAPSATWRAAVRLGAKLPGDAEGRAQERWLNYYDAPNCFPNVTYDRALSDDEVSPGFFRDQIVFIGGRSTLGTLTLGKDDFRTPFGLFGEQFAKGVEIHLTTFLNLLRGDWLIRLDPQRELWIVALCGLLLGGGLPWLRPLAGAGVALLAIAALVVATVALQAREHVWFAWAVPALVQAPLALGWAVGTRYFIEERRRRRLLDAFGCYLSPHMAQRIADADVDLRPGGKVVEATVMFTDLEDYTGLCERMDNPERISQVLTTYFTHTTGHILENDGTIIKYMGDSVQAVWGAPLADGDHVRKAVRAAWRLHVASRIECEGHPLRTRIGLNTGQLLAGNLGSAQRFDYTVTGDPVNFASRLETLNKRLGTDILISDRVQAALDREFITRPLGRFRVVGKKDAQEIHELLGPAEPVEERPWLATFAHALAAFRRGDFDAAERGLRETSALRVGSDPPSLFYLAYIAGLRSQPPEGEWSGAVELSSK